METLAELQAQLAAAQDALARLREGRMVRAVQIDDVRREYATPKVEELERTVASLQSRIAGLGGGGSRRRALVVVL